MNRTYAVAIAFGVTLGTSGRALAQPAYGPNAGYYPYAPPPDMMAVQPPPPPMYQPLPYQDTHTDGGASRAYSYWGAQKSN